MTDMTYTPPLYAFGYSCPALATGGDDLFVRKFIEESEYDTYEREVNASLAIPPEKKHLFCAVVAHGKSIKYVRLHLGSQVLALYGNLTYAPTRRCPRLRP